MAVLFEWNLCNAWSGKHALRIGMGCEAQAAAVAGATARTCNEADRPSPQMRAALQVLQRFLDGGEGTHVGGIAGARL
ncbi:hypothetical protein GCM10022279_15350 [Comamonas faecalis]|uniref:Uncharacterized protein n=1 Tax=Comamonas faecalis TaxID=1387849 RepID=A0ABP7R5U4_9BURK